MIIKENPSIRLKLQEIAREAQRREMETLEEELALTEPHAFSGDFNQKMSTLMSSGRKPYLRYINTVGKRAAVILVAVIMALTVAFSVKAIREPIIDFIIKTYKTFTTIFFDADDGIEKPYPDIIEDVYLPEYMPKDYIMVEHKNYLSHVETIYSDGNDDLIFEQYMAVVRLGVDTESVELEEIIINGKVLLFFSNKGMNHLLWTDDTYAYQIMGVIDKEEMIKMVKLTKN